VRARGCPQVGHQSVFLGSPCAPFSRPPTLLALLLRDIHCCISPPHPLLFGFISLSLSFPRSAGAGSLSAVEGFVLGAVAKSVATAATYPLQLAQTRLRKDKTAATAATAGGPPAEEQSTLGCLKQVDAFTGRFTVSTAFLCAHPRTLFSRPLHTGATRPIPTLSPTAHATKSTRAHTPSLQVVAEEGYGGLFVGLEAKFLQAALTSALIFGSYETLLAALHSGVLAPRPARR